MVLADTLPPEKERQILDGAATVFAADGYEGASMSRIAVEAGVSKGTLYNYFASKAELFAAFVQRECSRNILVLFDDLDREAPPEETLLRIGERMLRMLVSDPGLLMYRMVVAEAGKFPELAQAFWEAGPARVKERMADWIRHNAAAGRLRVDDADFAAEQLAALMQTQLCVKRRLRLIDHVTDEQIQRVVKSAVRVFLHFYGVEKPPPL